MFSRKKSLIYKQNHSSTSSTQLLSCLQVPQLFFLPCIYIVSDTVDFFSSTVLIIICKKKHNRYLSQVEGNTLAFK